MTQQKTLAAVVMAAGLGTRMRSQTPKHLHPLLGRRLVDWAIAAAASAGPDPLVVVVSSDTAGAFEGLTVAVQERPLGTGDAVRVARGQLEGADEILVVPGDHPLLTGELIGELVAQHRGAGAAATVLSFSPPDPRAYGRIVRGPDGRLAQIVEASDATPEQLELGELNASMYVFVAAKLWPALDRLQPVNAQGELYLTDAVRFLVEDGERVEVFEAPDPSIVEGVNTRAELAASAAALRERINRGHMLAGATIVDPATTWIEAGVELDTDTVIHPFTVLRGSTRVAAGAEIGPHAVAVDAVVGPDVTVGPFCYLRPGTVLEAGAKAGTFVEIKNSTIGPDAKVPHLSYMGDADVGEGANIAAGNITANLEHGPAGRKGRTRIGRNVKTGVHDTFVAPVDVGDDAWLAAGSVIAEDVPAGSLAGFPPRQVTKEGWVYEHGKRDD
jgi:bifunctional UDP-N-acetylglucosamine pyrophosphorylase/glucosamine-1-phosphate N-acetyltransferase